MSERSSLQQLFRGISTYSLDVAAGSVMMGIYASVILKTHSPFSWYVILFLAVWVFYTADHLLDAIKSKGESTIRRHKAHYIYRNKLLPIWIMVALFTGLMALYTLEIKIIYAGLILGIFILIYFILLYFNRKRFPWLLQKELIIGVVYVAGIWLAPLYWHETIPSVKILAIIVNMVLLVWAEGIMVSRIEYKQDTRNNHTSFTTMFGRNTAKTFVIVLLLTVLGIAFYFLFFSSCSHTVSVAFLIQILMSLSLAAINRFADRFRPSELYRYLGELIFWLPGLIIFV